MQLGLETVAEDKDLFFYAPDRESDDQLQPTFRPQMPLHNKAGEPGAVVAANLSVAFGDLPFVSLKRADNVPKLSFDVLH